LHGLLLHSYTSSEHVGPLKPSGQAHLNLPLGRTEHVPPLLHGEDAQRFAFSQFLPAFIFIFSIFLQ
jgi:hypothetical protein